MKDPDKSVASSKTIPPDPRTVSAFSVYKGLVPNLKSYTDTNSPTQASQRKKARKRNKNKSKKEEEGITMQPSVNGHDDPETSKSKKKKNRKRKRKEKEQAQQPEPQNHPVPNKRSKPETEVLPNPLATNINGTKVSQSSNRLPKTKKQAPSTLNLGAKSKTPRPRTIITSFKLPPPPQASLFNSKTTVHDSVSYGKSVLEWLLHPISVDHFMKDYWESAPLVIKRGGRATRASETYKFIMSSQGLDDVFRRNVVRYGVNVDVTSYTEGVGRETLSDAEGMRGARVRPAVVWDYYGNGCSIRMLNPQTYVSALWRVNAALQEYFGTFVGANLYLTPPDSQGFAPHYDDIEAFILQIEGKKRWKVYAPRSEDETLPRFSSRNFKEGEDELGELLIDVELEEGDLLYFPRGFVHQAKTVEGEHSMHITVSCQQLNTFGDLLKHQLNHAVDRLMCSDVRFREGLPVDYQSYMGSVYANTKDKESQKKREEFCAKVKTLVASVGTETRSVDAAADEMGRKFVWESLPPFLSARERGRSVVEDGEMMVAGKVFNRVEFGPETEVKWVRGRVVRVVEVEEGGVKLYYSSENGMVWKEGEENCLEIAEDVAGVVRELVKKYPAFVKVEELGEGMDDAGKIQLISDLWERGLILTQAPLEPCGIDEEIDGDEDEDEEVESVNLSDLPEDEDDVDDDDFYDKALRMGDSDEDDSEEGEEEEEEEFDFGDEVLDDDDVQADQDYFEYLMGADDDDKDESDEEGEEEEGEEEESEVDNDEFDRMDRMGESDEDDDSD